MGETGPRTTRGARATRLGLLAIAALVGASAVWGMSDAVMREPPVWGFLGFEAVTLIAAVIGILLGLGRPREAPALAAACVGATIFAAATLGRFSAIVTRSDGTVSEGQALARLVRDPVFDGRVLAAAVFVGAAVVFALGGDRRAWRRLIVGALLAAPVLAVGAWLLMGSGLNWLMAPVESFGGAVRIVVAVVGALALAILASVSAHSVIGAFESRLPPWPGEERRPSAPKQPA
ncbi:MAG TPA: hypothetical protein VFF69_07315 [Phycisphaerales bacterium]|nr:hypothetical protein [Phycisphaerales bacterium]